MKITRNINVLRAMERRGFVSLHADTGKLFKLNYPPYNHKAYYVKSGLPSFEYKNKTYITRHLPGAFFPFIYEQC